MIEHIAEVIAGVLAVGVFVALFRGALTDNLGLVALAFGLWLGVLAIVGAGVAGVWG